MRKLTIYSCLLLLVFLITTCKVDDTETQNDELFIKFSANSINYHYIENNADYKDDIYFFEANNGTFGFGGGLRNDYMVLNNLLSTPLNEFQVIFHNTMFDNIIEGEYPIKNSIYDTRSENGVEIVWMTNEHWNSTMDFYKQSEDYKNCLSSHGVNGVGVCEQAMRGTHDFFSTRNINQPESKFTITKKYLKLYNKMRYCSDSNQQVYDLIVEGNFYCKTSSSLNSANIQIVSGEFRIHIPSPLKFDCPRK